MHLPVYQLAGSQAVLSGVQAGRRVFAGMVAEAAPPVSDETAYLDFSGIEVATSSFLRESVMAFRDYARSTLPNLYPVVANPSEAVTEELDFLLKHRKDALWSCRLGRDGEVTEGTILGELDSGHRIAFDMVARLRTASAPDLAAQGDAGVGPTAWNNRLAYLAARGLLMERRAGKSKIFTPVLETL